MSLLVPQRVVWRNLVGNFNHTFHPPYIAVERTDEHNEVHWMVEDVEGDWLPVDFSYEEGALEYISNYLKGKAIDWRNC